MKTTLFFSTKTALYSIVGCISLLISSCGSYQNSSYFDSDGIYGNSEVKKASPIVENNNNIRYKEYFNSMQNENTPTTLFNNVENDSVVNSNSARQSNNPNTTIIYVNDNGWNNNWGWNNNFGWNDPWGWNNWGWGIGWNNWGWNNWVWNNWGWNNWNGGWWGQPGFVCGNQNFFNNQYSYNQSRRGNANTYPSGVNRNYSQNNVSSSRRNSYTSSRTDNSNSSVNRRIPTLTNRTSSQTNNSTNTNSRTRTYSNSNSSDNNTPIRTYTPSSNSNNSRSSGSFGGGRSSGGGGSFGGGRSSGGGGRR